MRLLIVCLLLCAAAAATVSCGTESCGAQSECPVGFYCVLSFNGGRAEGGCEQDCVSSDDCEQPASNASRAVCTNDGRCRTEARPPRLAVFDPEPEQSFEEGTQRIRVAGEVEMAAPEATIIVTSSGNRGCGTGLARQVTVTNDTGDFASVPFVIDDVLVDPGLTQLAVQAVVTGAGQTYPVPIEVACPGCAEVTITSPLANSTGSGLRLSALQGQVNTRIPAAVWRVRGLGGVLDGRLSMAADGRNFSITDLPLFPGANRVEVLVTGVGSGRAETRCSIRVNAGVSVESGLRAILTWDGPTSDLDLHLVGPGGQYGDPGTSLSSRTRDPTNFSGTVEDDFDGLGPEVLAVPSVPDGAYGLVVEAVFDGDDPGATAFLRLLYDGQTLTSGPIGPRYVKALTGDLWVVGVLEVSNGQATFRSVDEPASAAMPPMTPPSMWPALF